MYRHPRSGIAGQHPTRTYKDHWDHLSAGSDTVMSSKHLTEAGSKIEGGNNFGGGVVAGGRGGGHGGRGSTGSVGGRGGGDRVQGTGVSKGLSRVVGNKTPPNFQEDINPDEALDRSRDEGAVSSRVGGKPGRKGGWGGAWEDQA